MYRIELLTHVNVWNADDAVYEISLANCWETYIEMGIVVLLRRGAGKSLARPGRTQATATKLGMDSTYFPNEAQYTS